MGQLTQTTAQVQVILDDADAANVGKTSLTDSTDTTAVAVRKSGFYSLGASSSNAPSTDRAILISAVRDTTATGEIRYGQVAITESNGMWWNRDDGGVLGTWYEAVSTAGTQTLTNKTLTSPVLTTPQINDASADHQYVFAVSELVADRTVTLPLLTGNDTFVFEAHTQTLTNKTLTSPVFNTSVSGSAVLDEDDMSSNSATQLATQQSIKAYVDSQVTAQDLDFAGDSGTGAVDLDSQTFTIAGTTNEIETSASGQTLTVGLPSAVAITTSLNIASSTTVDGVLDEDNMATNSATKLATQQSIKAYVDAQVATSDTLAEVLSNGNTTGSTNIVVTAGQSITTDTIAETTSAAGVTVDSLLIKDGGITAAGTSTFAGQTISDLGTVTTANIDGGSIDGTTIGASTAAAGTFTTVTADGGVSVDNITIDGTEIDLSSGDLTIDVAGDIILDADGGDIKFKDGGTEIGSISLSGSNVSIVSAVSDEDIFFKGNDGGSPIDALFLDMSEAGAATFNAGADFGGTVTADGLTVDGAATISVSDNSDNLSLISTDADDNSGPNLRMYRNSASPDDADVIGQIDFEGRNDNSQDVRYGFISAKISDASDGSEDGQLRFFTIAGGTETQTLTMESGNVGVGIQTPGVRLHVEGDTDSNVMIVNNIGTAPNYIFDVRDDGVSKFRVAPSGNVGIGTASPALASGWSRAVHVNGTGSGAQIQFTDSTTGATNTDGLLVGQYQANSYFINRESGFQVFYTANTEAMRIDSGQRLGLSNSSPASYTGSGSNTFVLGNSSVSNGSHGMTIVAGNQATSSIAFSDHGGDGGTADYRGLFQYVHADDSLKIWTASTQRMAIDSSGVLLIGAPGGNSTGIIQGSSGAGSTNQPGTDLQLKGGSGGGTGGSKVRFFTAPGGSSGTAESAAVERMYIDEDGVAHFNGDVKVLSGDVIMGSGRGINFTANSNASGMTSETLDDYEEGTWTPTVSSGTVTTGTSRYTKVGRLVTCYTQLTSFSDTTSTATVTIGGLPVAAEANDRATTLGVLAQHIANIGSITGGYLASTSTLLLYNTSSSGFTNLQHEDLDGSSSIYISFSYFAT